MGCTRSRGSRGFQCLASSPRPGEPGRYPSSSMLTLDSIKSRFYELTRQVDAPNATFRTTPGHDGSTHCECDDVAYHCIVTERGQEIERRSSSDPDEILYWLISDVTWGMAINYELRNRDTTSVNRIDGRRVWMPYQVSLLKKVDEQWADRKQFEHDAMLSTHPYNDG